MNFSQALAKIKENEEIRAKPTPIAMVAPELKQNTEDTEITKTCAVLGCEESKNLNPDSFFRFPEDPNYRQIWTDLTGRNNWTPTDYSYICVQHFSVDCFECDIHNSVVLNRKAVPSLKLPKHVLEVEYIDEETLDNEYEDDYDDEDQDYEMENDAENNREYEEHLDEDQMSEDHIEEDYFSEDQSKENHRQDVSSSKHLTNGAYSHTTEKSSTSHYVNKTEKPSTSRVDKKIEKPPSKTKDDENLELLKLFTEVQKMQKQAASLKHKLKTDMRGYKRQSRCLARLKEEIDMKKNLLVQRRKKKSRILLSLQDKIKEDTNGLVLAMPTRHTDDLKNFSLSVYKYSPQAYIYIRNTLRTLLPSTDVLDSWILSGYEPKNVLSNSNSLRVVSELTETELSCKVSLR